MPPFVFRERHNFPKLTHRRPPRRCSSSCRPQSRVGRGANADPRHVRSREGCCACMPRANSIWCIDTRSNGTALVAGKRVTDFTNGEENTICKYALVSLPTGPGSCEDVLFQRGATIVDGGVFQIERDRRWQFVLRAELVVGGATGGPATVLFFFCTE